VDEDDAPRTAAEQLDLAQAYLDVGDEDAARTLLREVIDGRDPAAREAAARLLREL
jgi:pilus assembly protein FimV